MILVNLSQDKSLISPYISETLLGEIDACLGRNEKILLYLNKRGAFSSMICEDCQYLFGCPNCDISLTVHSSPKSLKCHACQTLQEYPLCCPQCNGTRLKAIGVGTQEIESCLSKKYNNKKIYRFDSDSMKTLTEKKQAQNYLENSDIIIGTKMISTGFNIQKVGLIGIILVESELGFPSYDSEENAYATLRQVIGRGNRKGQKTEILLQTFVPNNEVIKGLSEYNFKDFLSHTLQQRKKYNYPPYTEAVFLEYRHSDKQKALNYIQKLSQKLSTLDTEKKYKLLPGTDCFKKSNSFHAKLLIRGENIRDLLQKIQSDILREKCLSVIFI